MSHPDASDRTALERAEAAFEAGDYREVRRLCARIGDSSDADVRTGALDLKRRVSVDPAQVTVLLGCLAFFAVIVYLYVLR